MKFLHVHTCTKLLQRPVAVSADNFIKLLVVVLIQRHNASSVGVRLLRYTGTRFDRDLTFYNASFITHRLDYLLQKDFAFMNEVTTEEFL